MRHHVRVRLDLLQEAEILQPRHDLLARGETVDAVQLFRQHQRAFGQSAQIVLVVDEGHAPSRSNTLICGRPCRLPTSKSLKSCAGVILTAPEPFSGSA